MKKDRWSARAVRVGPPSRLSIFAASSSQCISSCARSLYESTQPMIASHSSRHAAWSRQDLGVCLIRTELGVCFLWFIGASSIFAAAYAVYFHFVRVPFKSHLREFTSAIQYKPTTPYVKGKIVIINKSEDDVDVLQTDLTDHLRARKPEDVGTIVWIERSNVLVGHYARRGDLTSPTDSLQRSAFARLIQVSLVVRSLNNTI